MRNNVVHLGEAINSLMKEWRLDEKLNENILQAHWHDVMGKTIAKYTIEVRLFKKVLTIKCSVAPLKQELLYNKAQIIEKVNDFLKSNAVKELVII